MVAAYPGWLGSASQSSIRVANCVSTVRPTLYQTWRRCADRGGVCKPVGKSLRRTIRNSRPSVRALKRGQESPGGRHATSQSHAPVESGQVADRTLDIHSSQDNGRGRVTPPSPVVSSSSAAASSPPPSSSSAASSPPSSSSQYCDPSTSSQPLAPEESSRIESDSSLATSEKLTEWLLCKEVAMAEGEAGPSSDAHVNAVSEDGGGSQEEVSYFQKLYEKISPRMRGLILLNMLTLLYGSNMSVIKDSQLGLDPATFSVGRFAIATAVFLPFLGTALQKKSVRMAGIEMGVWAAGGYLTQAHALLTTEAGRASFISTITVVEVPLVAGLFGARVPPVTWLAAAAAVGGVSLLESGGSGAQNGEWYGEFWTLVSALFFGVHMLRSEYHSKHLDREDAIPLISLQLAVTCAFSVAWALLAENEAWGGVLHQLTNGEATGVLQAAVAAPWIPMIYTGLLSTALCLWIEVVSLRDVTATDAAMVYTLEPLYGAAFAWGLLGERWGWRGWAGAALILGGSVVMQVFGDKEAAEGKGDGGGGEVSNHSASAALAAAAVATILVGGAEPQGAARGEETSGEAAMERRRGDSSEASARRGRGGGSFEEDGSGFLMEEVSTEESSSLSESCVEFGGESRGEEAEGRGQGGDLDSIAAVVRLQALRDVEGEEGKGRKRGGKRGNKPQKSSQ